MVIKSKPKSAEKGKQKKSLSTSTAAKGKIKEPADESSEDKAQKKDSQASNKTSGNHMSKQLDNYSDQILPEIPELDEILALPKNVREEAFVRAVCTAHKAKNKASKKVKQTLSWMHTESEN